MISANFNIHNILKINFIWYKKYRSILKGLDLKLDYFSVNDVKNPDITVEIGPFSPDLKDCRVYERKFFVKENFVYANGGSWRRKWAVQISGLDEDKLIVKLNAEARNLRGFIVPNMIIDNLILPLLELKFPEKGYMLIHSGAVSKNENGYLLVGRGGSAKTSIVMDLIRKYDYKYVGDDRVLIGLDKSLMSFPTYLQIFEFLLKRSKTEVMSLFTKLRLISYLLNKKSPRIAVADRSNLSGVILLMPSNNPYAVKRLSEEKSVGRIMLNILMEYFEMCRIVGLDICPVFECIMAYSAAFPNSKVSKIQDRLESYLKTALRGLPIYEVSIPIQYRDGVADVINNLIEGEMS